MTSKLTTYCGAVGAVASIVATYGFGPMTTKIASCVAACATGAGLYFARDNHVSDEVAGASPTAAKPADPSNKTLT